MSTGLHIHIAELALEQKLITAEQLKIAVEEQKKTGDKISDVLIKLRFIDERRLLKLIASQLDIPYIELKAYPLDLERAKKLPERLARHHRALLLQEKSDSVLIGMVDPQNIFAIDEIRRFSQKPIQVAIISEKECLAYLDFIYRRTDEIHKFASELSTQFQSGFDLDTLEKTLGQEDIPVSKLLHSLFEDAVQINASDIHIEPEEHLIRLRYRVDGVLQEQIVNEAKAAPILAQRLKILAHLNIMEKRLPQDGHFGLKVKNRNYDIRLSTMPTQFGESIVMRLLEKNAKLLSMNELELPSDYIERLRELINAPHGMILSTGPTGSGKTTTLFALLNELNSPQLKIITIEDPVEYHFPRLNQIQVNPSIDLSFARILRSSLRQDPDILMIGEIRDAETASIALRAAMTGHLILSTLHTNDTISTISRLLDLGCEPYLIASALRVLISQRLLRKLCDNCKQDYQPNPIETDWLLRSGVQNNPTFCVGKGCHYCNGTGFKGRFAIFEILILDTAMLSALRQNQLREFIALAEKQRVPLWQSALQATLDHKTSLSEALPFITSLEAESEIDRPMV